MPEVQKPVLEHAPTEAQNPQVTGVTITQKRPPLQPIFKHRLYGKRTTSFRPSPTSVPSGGPCIPKISGNGHYNYLTACVSEHFVELGVGNQ